MTTATPTQHGESAAAESVNEPAHEPRRDRFGHELPSYDDINTPVIVLVGVISAILTFLTIAFVEGLSHHWQNGLIQTLNYEVANPRQVDLINSQKAVLEGDEKTGVISLQQVIPDVIAKYRQRDESGEQAGAAENQDAADSGVVPASSGKPESDGDH